MHHLRTGRTALLCTLWATALLAGCGDGNQTESAGAPPVSQPTPSPPPSAAADVASLSVAFEGPLAGGRTPDSLISPFQEVAFGQPVAVRSTERAALPQVFALDSTGAISIAGRVAGGRVELSAAATAEAFILLVAGASTDGQSGAFLLGRARQSPQFANLTSAISDAYSAGRVVASDSAVVARLVDVLRFALVRETASSRRRPQAIETPRIDRLPLPAAIRGAPSASGVLNVELYSATRDTIGVRNYTPIAWDLEVLDVDGSRIQSTQLGGADWLQLVAGRVVPALGPDTQSVQRGTPGSFSLRTSQSAASRLATLGQLVLRFIGPYMEAAEVSSSASCLLQLELVAMNAVATINPPAVVADPTVVLEWITDLILSRTPWSLAEACVWTDERRKLTPLPLAKWLGAGSKTFALLVGGMANLDLFVDIATLGTGVLYLAKYYNAAPQAVGVCVGRDSLPARCATRLDFVPEAPPRLLPGASIPLLLEPRAADGSPTPVPFDLVRNWKSSSAPDGTPALVIDDTWRVFARARGVGGMDVSDPATGVSATVGFITDDGVLKPASVDVSLNGSPGSLQLLDSNGATLFTEGASLRWTALPTAGLPSAPMRLLANDRPPGPGDTSVAVVGSAEGEGVVELLNEVSGVLLRAQVIVRRPFVVQSGSIESKIRRFTCAPGDSACRNVFGGAAHIALSYQANVFGPVGQTVRIAASGIEWPTWLHRLECGAWTALRFGTGNDLACQRQPGQPNSTALGIHTVATSDVSSSFVCTDGCSGTVYRWSEGQVDFTSDETIYVTGPEQVPTLAFF